MSTSRLEAFSDGVLAIIITIMVLELHVPHGDDLSSLWHTTGTSLLSYLLSFAYVGIYWNNHHHMFQLVRRIGGAVLWANLALLFCLSLFPFTTAWMDDSSYSRTPVVVYGADLLMAATAYYVLQSVIIRVEGRDAPLRRAIGRDLKGKGSMVLYLAGIACAIAVPAGERIGVRLGVAFYVLVAALWIVPDRRIDRAVREHGASD